jgi:hypothetical protein
MEHALICPQCNAPLTPHRFASQVVCAYCGTTVQLDGASVSSAVFHEAFRQWNSPGTYSIPTWISIGNRNWALEKLMARGELSDVYTGRLARWPTELVLVKLLRDPADAALFENEWTTLQALQQSDAPGAAIFSRLLPQPILHGEVTGGASTGSRASLFRWASGFYHTFEDVMRAYPQGIPPRAAIWVWRRILEILSFIHSSGMAHGAVLPAHLLVQENEHGLRLVGYSRAGPLGQKLPALQPGPFYPRPDGEWSTLTAQLDLVMSARCLAAILGGDPQRAVWPAAVPARLAGVVQRVGRARPGRISPENAWGLREELGALANEIFGPPQFIPISLPG